MSGSHKTRNTHFFLIFLLHAFFFCFLHCGSVLHSFFCRIEIFRLKYSFTLLCLYCRLASDVLFFLLFCQKSPAQFSSRFFNSNHFICITAFRKMDFYPGCMVLITVFCFFQSVINFLPLFSFFIMNRVSVNDGCTAMIFCSKVFGKTVSFL